MNKHFLVLTRTVAVIGLVCGLGQFAKADIIDFENQAPGQYSAGYSFTEGAFTVTALPGDPGNTMTIQDVGGSNGNVFVDGDIGDEYGTEIEITLTAGGTFDLNSLDVADLNNQGAGVGCGSGTRIEVTFDIAGCLDYGPSSSTFTTETVGVTGITDLYINIPSVYPNDFAVDNINVTADAAAPEPATFLLAGVTGLFGFAARRFRRS